MSSGSWLWEAPSVVFYEVWSLQELLWRLEVTNVSRILVLGGSIYCILRGLEAPGAADSKQPKTPGGSPLKPFARLRRFGGDECLEELGSARLKVSYSTRSRGSRRSCGGWK